MTPYLIASNGVRHNLRTPGQTRDDYVAATHQLSWAHARWWADLDQACEHLGRQS